MNAHKKTPTCLRPASRGDRLDNLNDIDTIDTTDSKPAIYSRFSEFPPDVKRALNQSGYTGGEDDVFYSVTTSHFEVVGAYRAFTADEIFLLSNLRYILTVRRVAGARLRLAFDRKGKPYGK